MKKDFQLRCPDCNTPPNSEYQILPHPSGDLSHSMELAVFNDHRFAFYFWIKWNQENKWEESPDLITFDWHQDLAPFDQDELQNLNTNKLENISSFAWTRLNPLNDNHILSAAFLDQINNIWVVCKQNPFSDWKDIMLTDRNKKRHVIKKFKNKSLLLKELVKTNINNLYFDLDLDYFTIENSNSNDKHRFTYTKKGEIEDIFNPYSDFMKFIFQRICGFTIALEPHHTGGILKSFKYLTIIHRLLFKNEQRGYSWKHL